VDELVSRVLLVRLRTVVPIQVVKSNHEREQHLRGRSAIEQ